MTSAKAKFVWQTRRKKTIKLLLCKVCLKIFFGYPHLITNKRTYCSRDCYKIGITGRKRDKSIGRKVSISQIKRWDKIGRKTVVSLAIRTSKMYTDWREAVFERDDYTCQQCGVRGAELNADHYPKTLALVIKENNIKTLQEAILCEKLWDISNGRTLCVPCHRATDTYGVVIK